MTNPIANLIRMADIATPYAVRVAATLRLPQLISEGSTRLDELAEQTHAHPDALGRVLRLLVLREVFTKPEPDTFGLTETGRLLLDDGPFHLRSGFDLDGFGRADLRDTLVELPTTAAFTERRIADSGLSKRCTVIAGSFFDQLPAGASTYLLSFILHDWIDRDAIRILDRCAKVAGTDGRISLIERTTIDTKQNEDFIGMDLRLPVYFGGKERTLEEFHGFMHRPEYMFGMFGAHRMVHYIFDPGVCERWLNIISPMSLAFGPCRLGTGRRPLRNCAPVATFRSSLSQNSNSARMAPGTTR